LPDTIKTLAAVSHTPATQTTFDLVMGTVPSNTWWSVDRIILGPNNGNSSCYFYIATGGVNQYIEPTNLDQNIPAPNVVSIYANAVLRFTGLVLEPADVLRVQYTAQGTGVVNRFVAVGVEST
jgi:hypothetical protein